MELQFQRSAPMEDEFASVLLKPGDSIDDSVAIFDAINFSGGVKRALMSLSVGIHFHLLVLLMTAIPFHFTLINKAAADFRLFHQLINLISLKNPQ